MPWLEWHNRNDDLKAAAKPPYRLLQPVQSLSHGDEDAPNMLIQGDNLEALKALLPYYAGQVKCIFIDPPYNTKSAFEHYDDNLEHAYPDFIAKLKDGRIFVIEYKGDDRYDHPKNQAKRAVGELWARKYPAGLYLMPREKDDAGRDIDEQIAHAIAAGR